MATTFSRVADTVRDAGRTRQILAVLLRNGFGDLLARLPLEGPLSLGARALRRSSNRSVARLSRGERIRRTLEELGPTFVKFGQLVSGRPDLLPSDLIEELEKLRDEVAPMPAAEARAVVEAELGSPLAASFPEFEESPMAAGSIAQVHRATLADGRRVAVKIQRLDIQPVIDADLRILGYLATLAAGRLVPTDVVDPVAVVEELGRMLERETDFRLERRTMLRFLRNFEGDATVRIPAPIAELSTERVLTMELVEGLRPGSSPQELIEAGLDPKRLARRGASAFVRMAFEHGLFHADPHGGNLLFCPGDVVAFLDFGATGRLDELRRERILDLVTALAARNSARAAEVLLDLGSRDEAIDRIRLEDEIADLVEEVHGVPIGEIALGPIVGEIFDLLRRHRIRFPADLVVLSRALACLEAEGKRLDPGFDMASELEEPFTRLLRARLSPQARMKRWLGSAERFGDLLTQVPTELKRVLTMLEEKNLEVKLSHRGLEGLVREIDRASNRIAFALIVAALVVGSAIVSNLGRGPFVAGYPAVGVLGFILAGLLGLWLIVAILRSGKL